MEIISTSLKFIILGITTFIALLAISFALDYDGPMVFQNILFVPLVLSGYLFRKKGLLYSFLIIAAYSLIVVIHYGFQLMIGSLSIRVAFFVFISSLVSFLFERLISTRRSLQESTMLWNFAIEATGDVVWDWDMKNDLVTFSERYRTLLGYSDTTVKVDEKSWRKIIHPDDYNRLVKDFNEYISGNAKFYKNERRVLCKSGEYKWILDRGKLIERTAEGKPLRMIGTYSDITERKTIELENQRISKLIEDERSLFLAGPVIVFKWRNEHLFPVEYVSKNIEEVLGYSAELFTSKEVLMRDILYKEDLEKLLAEIQKDGYKGVFAFKHNPYRLINKQGKIVWVYDYTTAIKNEKGEVTHYIGYLIDITAKMEIEIALQETNIQYKMLIDNISDLIYRTDLDNNILFVSPSIYNSLGLSREQIIGQKYIPNTHEEDIQNIALQLAKLSKPPYECSFESRILTEEGWNWFAWKVKTQFDLSGKEIGRAAIGRNITALKNYQEILQDSEKKFRTIAENAPFPLMIRSFADGTVLYMNIKAEDLLECKREEIINKEKIFRFFLDPIDKSRITDVLNNGAGVKDFEMRFKTYLGKPIWIMVSLNRITYVNTDVVVSSYINITDKKLADTKLKESEERYRILAENASDMISKHDLAGNYSYVSPTCYDLTGYTQGELTGKNAYNFILQEDVDAVSKSHQFILDNFQSTSVRYRIIRKNGSLIWVETTSKTIIDESNESLAGIIAVTRDITERVLAEEKQINLERKFLEAQKFESLGVMASGIAHDYNTFLLGIMGNLELAKTFMDNSSKSYKYIEKSISASKKAAEITKQILTFLGHTKFVQKPISLNTIIRNDFQIINQVVRESILLQVNMTEDIPDVNVDETLVAQALLNLVTNSGESIHEKDGLITISTNSDYLSEEDILSSRLSEKPHAGFFSFLIVEDTGEGMESKTLQRIFEPFYTTKATGRGLGTAAVLGIVRMHKGVIFVDSEPGKGTKIKLGFPVV